MNDPILFTKGMRGYASIVAVISQPRWLARPATADAISERVQAQVGMVRGTMRRLHAYGVVHIGGWHRDIVHGPFGAVWAFGAGTDAPYPNADTGWMHADRRDRPAYSVQVELQAFAFTLQALADPHTVASLCELTGLYDRTIRRLLTHMKRLGLVRIASWERPRSGPPMPMFALGAGRDADRPRPATTAEIWKRHYERKAAKRATVHLIRLTAAPIHPEPLPLAA